MRNGNEAERHGSRLPLTAIVPPVPISNTGQQKTFKKPIRCFHNVVVFNPEKPVKQVLLSSFSQVKRAKSEK